MAGQQEGVPTGAGPGPDGAGFVRIVSADVALVARLRSLAAAAGVRVGDGPGAHLVLLGADAAVPDDPSTNPGVPEDAPVVVVSAGEPAAGVWRAAVQVRAEHVAVLPDAEPWLLGRLGELATRGEATARVVAVVGGRGGAGASVLAAALARTAAARGRTLLLDADPLGGGADLLLGAEDEPGLRWADLADLRGRLLPGTLTGGLPVIDGLYVLCPDRGGTRDTPGPAAAEAVLGAAVREMHLVVADLPRAPDPGADVVLDNASTALLVVPAEVRATAAARRVADRLVDHVADVRVVVRGPAPTGLRGEAVAEALDLPLAGTVRPEPGLAAALDRGEPPGLRGRGPLATLCRRLATDLLDPAGPDLVR